MSILQIPNTYNMESLFLYCELTTRSELAGNTIDFGGINTYNIGLYREGLGFGITSINIDISPSMQPVIDITFKDFYGNMAIEFNRNKDFINGIVGGNDNLNYSSIFELPYPKFKLTLKGYLGRPVALDLNVKRIDVNYQPNDGSYEIKATFIPNLYGFFSDMPFYFLKSINYLKNRNNKSKEITLFDIIETGLILEQRQQVVIKNIEEIKQKLTALYNQSDSILDDSFNFFEPIENISKDNKPLGFNKLYINIGKFLKRNNKTDQLTLQNSASNSKINKNFLRSAKINDKNKYIQMIVASISETKKENDNELIYLYDDFRRDFSQELSVAKGLIKNALEKCEEYEKSQYSSTNKELLKQVTIETVFDLIVRDSSYLLGRILQAGKKGFSLFENQRRTDKNIIGLYFPLKQNESTNEQEPAVTEGPEFDFVNDFITALSKGLAEEKRRQLNENTIPTPDNSESLLKKRSTNLELGSQNPYSISPTSKDIISNILERTGIIAHLFMDDISITIEDKSVSSAIESELLNINEGLKKLNELEISDLNSFCETIKKEINEDGEFIDPDFIDNGFKKSVIGSRLLFNKDMDLNLLKAKKIQNNNLYYINTKDVSDNGSGYWLKDFYILFDLNKYKNSASMQNSINYLLSNEGDSNAPYESSGFELKKINSENVDELEFFASNKNLIDFDAMQKELQKPYNKIDINKIFYTGVSQNVIFENIDKGDRYFYGKFISNRRGSSEFIWDFTGDTDEAVLQRFLLLQICKKIQSIIKNNQKEQDGIVGQITENLMQGNGYKIIYNQFHNLCNNWKNLISTESSNNITEHIVGKFCNNKGAANIFYDIPLLSIQGYKRNINIKDAIINIEPLRNSNEQSSVLNIMSNICVKNNFMFLAIPGIADKDALSDDNKILQEPTISELFTPYDKLIEKDSVPVNNHFYVIWMPTPENRAKYNSGNPVYSDFDPKTLKIQNGIDLFEINYGSSNNTIFRSITMSTEDNKMTSESAIAINSIADPANSKKYKNYDCSALSVMEGRSYKISVEMIGNAQIKPTQFFILNSTHIFSGLYQIMKVVHNIRPNDMTTKFEAIKMKYSGNKDFMFIPPITLQDITSNQYAPFEQTQIQEETQEQIVTESDGFPVSESTMNDYVGTITHPSIDIPNRALLDTVSYLDNGINTGINKGYDVLVKSSLDNSKGVRVIPNWSFDYPDGMNFDDWKVTTWSPSKQEFVTSSAAGRYQIIYTTWRSAAPQVSTPFTGVVVKSNNPPFNKDNQDIVANFLMTSRLHRSGLNSSDIEEAYSNIEKFDKILMALQEEWESIKLLRRNKQFKKMSIKDVYDFFVYAYDVYKKNS